MRNHNFNRTDDYIYIYILYKILVILGWNI